MIEIPTTQGSKLLQNYRINLSRQLANQSQGHIFTFGVQDMADEGNQSHLPNMSSDTGTLRISPVNSHNVCFASIPAVPSNTCK